MEQLIESIAIVLIIKLLNWAFKPNTFTLEPLQDMTDSEVEHYTNLIAADLGGN